jgi:hypothetical protein
MADKKISELTALTTANDSIEFVINDGGASKKITRANIFSTGIDVTGNVTTTGHVEVSTGNLVIGTAGKGIDFSGQTSANSVTGVTTGDEVLDHYEEGTWTPISNTSITYTAQGGIYTRVGNLVTATFTLAVPVNTNAVQMYVSGLPFGESGVGLQNQSVTHGGSVGYTTMTTPFRYAVSVTSLIFYDTGNSPLTYAEASGQQIRGTITYKTDS